jgi:UDP-N-acetylglucosamine--N-acetylmuramyl-(pentapeptide) pyrophosphoryl-undecaprenol N-acetylglucosamine transferase
LDERFEIEFLSLLNSAEKQKMLGENIKKLARPNATKAIVAEIENLLVKS